MMKIITKIIILFVAIINFACSAVPIDDECLVRYSLVKEYIKNDSTAFNFISEQNTDNSIIIKEAFNVRISKLVLPPEVANFAEFAVKNKKDIKMNGRVFLYNHSILDSLLKMEKELSYEPYLQKELTGLSDNNDTKGLLFFSKCYDDFLTAVLISDNDIESADDKNKLKFNRMLEYLFIFDGKKIKDVMYAVMYH